MENVVCKTEHGTVQKSHILTTSSTMTAGMQKATQALFNDRLGKLHGTPPPPLAQTRARFWFQDEKCGTSPDKPVLARSTYCGTQVAGIAQP